MISEVPTPGQMPETESLGDSIARLNIQIAEFEGVVAEFGEKSDAYYAALDQVDKKHTGLYLAQDELFNKRESQLRSELKSQGLAVCISSGSHQRDEIQDPLGRLGFFPEDQMTLLYSANTAIQRTSGYDGREPRRDVWFGMVCPSHDPTPKYKGHTLPNRYDQRLGPDMWTRVSLKDGKYIAEIDGSEIYGPPMQGHLNSEHYEHFGYPPIPEIPSKPRP